MSPPFSLYFDQLGGGESFETPGRTVTEADLVSFSALSGDWHPQHADADWADHVDRFLEAHFQANPVGAVYAGRHEFDGRLPDLSAANVSLTGTAA